MSFEGIIKENLRKLTSDEEKLWAEYNVLKPAKKNKEQVTRYENLKRLLQKVAEDLSKEETEETERETEVETGTEDDTGDELPKYKKPVVKPIGEVSGVRLVSYAKIPELKKLFPDLAETFTEEDGTFDSYNFRRFIVNGKNGKYLDTFKKDNLANTCYERYKNALSKEDPIIRSKLMKDAKKKFVGCVARHTPPSTYYTCMLDYNNPQEKYEEQAIIPNGLKQQEYESQLALGHPRRAEYLKPGPKEKMRYLPKGIHEYALTNPREVNLYQKELAAQSVLSQRHQTNREGKRR